MFAVLLLWLGVGTPLVFLGAFFGCVMRRCCLPVAIHPVAIRPVVIL